MSEITDPLAKPPVIHQTKPTASNLSVPHGNWAISVKDNYGRELAKGKVEGPCTVDLIIEAEGVV